MGNRFLAIVVAMNCRILGAVLTLAVAAACSEGSRHSREPGSSTEVDSVDRTQSPGIPERETPILDRYYPQTKHDWWSEEYYTNLNRADIAVADSYFQWFEATFDSWDKSIVHGYVPTAYLSRFAGGPDAVQYVDETNGRVPGIEKLKTVYPEMLRRCPTLGEPQFKAPLTVRWQDRNQPGNAGSFTGRQVELSDRPDGTVWPSAALLWTSEIEIKGEFVRPANTPEGWYGYQYPNQMFSELTRGKSWSEGGTVTQALDKTYAHELSHFFVQAWALNTGRNPTQSNMFAEFFAELVRSLCWGSLLDDPTRVRAEIDRGVSPVDTRPFGIDEAAWRSVSRRYQGVAYNLYSFESLIAWERQHERFNSDKMLRAAFATMEAMRGVKLDDYPAFDVHDGSLLTPLLPWSRTITNREIIRRAPKMFTKGEFLTKFCEYYACGELKFLIEADAEGTSKSEW